MADNGLTGMGRYRALMTDTDRGHITGESDPSQDQKDQAVYRVRQRIREELPRDIVVLREHRPDVLGELRETVCDDPRAEGGETPGESPRVDAEAVSDALDDLEAADERGDRHGAREALQRAREALEDTDD